LILPDTLGLASGITRVAMYRFVGDAAVLGVPNQFISQRLQRPTRASRIRG
jgi:hypothetical protein